MKPRLLPFISILLLSGPWDFAHSQTRFGECISMKSLDSFNCRPEEHSEHVKKTFEWESRNVVQTLTRLCQNPGGYNITNLSFTEISFNDGAKQLIFPLFFKSTESEHFIHFLAMERGKIVYASRKVTTDKSKGPRWHGKDGGSYGFTTTLAPDQQEFFKGSPLVGNASATLCEGFDQAQANEKFIADVQQTVDSGGTPKSVRPPVRSGQR